MDQIPPHAGQRGALGQLSQHFDELGALLGSADGSQIDPARVTDVAARSVPHSEYCSITVVPAQRRPYSIAPAESVPLAVDHLQYAADQGPCLETSRTHELTVVDDLSVDQRWPAFAKRCVERTGVRSMMCLRLVLNGDDRAAMNFYAVHPGAFDQLDAGVASIFAPFAAMAMQNALDRKHVSNLEIALESSRQIGIAMGILMAREHITPEQAFALLRDASQHLNRKVRDIAADVQYTGTLPEFRKK